jgi:hypothetical protein
MCGLIREVANQFGGRREEVEKNFLPNVGDVIWSD